jgi:hypothetical protein
MQGKKRDQKGKDKSGKEEVKEAKTSVEKSSAAVDHHNPNASSLKVVEEGGVALSSYLMWTDLKTNKNKFFVLQCLQNGKEYELWTRYGRVGDNGV